MRALQRPQLGFLLGATGLTRPRLDVIVVAQGAYLLLNFSLVPARVIDECLCIVHDKDLRRAAEVFECMNNARDSALVLPIGKWHLRR